MEKRRKEKVIQDLLSLLDRILRSLIKLFVVRTFAVRKVRIGPVFFFFLSITKLMQFLGANAKMCMECK